MNKGLSNYKIKKIMKHFCEDITASKTSALLDINRNTINRYDTLFRQKIAISNSGKGGDEFFLHLKECEFRFNNRDNNDLLSTMRNIWKFTQCQSRA